MVSAFIVIELEVSPADDADIGIRVKAVAGMWRRSLVVGLVAQGRLSGAWPTFAKELLNPDEIERVAL